MKVLIIEDEPAAARRIAKLLRQVESDVQILGTVESIEEGVEWLANHEAPELILSDIQLADGISFRIFEESDVSSPVIFTTAHDEYAIEAFHLHSVDYLLKPVRKEELQQALEKYRRLTKPAAIDFGAVRASVAEAASRKGPSRLLVRYGQQMQALEIDQAAYYYTENKIVYYQGFEGKRFALDQKLESIEQLVDPKKYFRINRQLIVNIDAIDHMIAYSKSRVKLTLRPGYTGNSVVSKERSPHFKAWLKGEESG